MKIYFAKSIEKNELLDAIKANELWENGELKDKRKFICPGKDCTVPVTCAGMDKFEVDQKRVPHFIWGHQNPKHSENCNYKELFDKWEQRFVGSKDSLKDKKDDRTIIFDTTASKNESNINHGHINEDDPKNDKLFTNKKRTGQNSEKWRIVKSHFSLLSSILNEYFSAKEENALDTKHVLLNMTKKSYTYRFSTLFKKINEIKFDKDNTKTKIYFGYAKIEKNKNKYYVKFYDKFKNDDSEIRCTIDANNINSTKNKDEKLRNLDRHVNENIQFFIMGNLNKVMVKGKNIIYINLYNDSLDLIAIVQK